ncbi:MAG TPA: rhodanese-like domain-containing protein [Draconibacterium sp.]|nr:rhodanese-like domain-containing protein [Draconibacterium sp.]
MNKQQKYYKQKLKYEIDSWDLNDSINNADNIKIIDTRSREAYKNEHIPGAINFPHREMTKETTTGFSKDFLYVCYCDGIGCNASTKGALNMTKLGFRVKELIGGLEWWKRDGYVTQGLNGISEKNVNCGC